MIYTHSAHIKYWRLLAGLSLAALLLGLTGQARAEEVHDPPRKQQAGGYNIEFVAPVREGNHDAETTVPFRFRVTDSQGRPVSGLRLAVTGIRDYSGQVKKEHNGPRTPNVGPRPLAAVDGAAGEYQADMRFNFNGHWYVQVDGPSLNGQKATFRTPVGVAEGKGAGINLDWLVWAGVLLTVIAVVVVIGRQGIVFPVPHDELQPPVPAPDPALEAQNNEPAALVTTGAPGNPVRKAGEK